MIISERIFKIMEERGMSQIEFSKATGIAQSTISDWKRKKTNPAADKIMVICEVLGVTPYDVLQDTTTKKPDGISYRYISEGSEQYDFIVEIDTLDKPKRDHLWGYISALKAL